MLGPVCFTFPVQTKQQAENNMEFAYKRVARDWHRLDTSHGTFFGYSREDVFTKAHLAAELSLMLKGLNQQHRAPVIPINSRAVAR